VNLRARLKRFDDRVVGPGERRWTAHEPPYWYRLGLVGSVIFGGGLLLRVLLPDALPTPPLFTAVYVCFTFVAFALVLAHLRGRTRLLVGVGLLLAVGGLVALDATRPCDGGPLKEAFLVFWHGGSYTVRCAG
jgi:hypothetical protein